MFANAFKRLTAAGRHNTAWLFLVVSMIPATHATSDGNAAVWHEIAHGRYDDEYEVMGHRLGRNLTGNGWSKDWLILRPNHEMNQSNVYRVFPDTRALYRAAMERAFQKLREGYGQRLRIVHSPARVRVIGPFDDWIPQSPLGGVDCLTVSLHPGAQVRPREDYLRFLDKFDEESYGTRRDCLAACRKLGLPYCNPEWSPNYGSAGNTPCPIAEVVMEETWSFFKQQAEAQNLVGEAVFGEETLDPDAYRGSDEAGREAWRRAVDVYRARWRGAPVGPPFEG
jgi:AcrR family transcriptional regulator